MSEYTVGYGKPPKETRFKPGQSGNRTGRPRGSRNTYTIFDKLLESKIYVNQDGEKTKMSKREALLMQLINTGLKGDTKAIKALFPHMVVSDDKKAVREAAKHQITAPTDDEILADYRKGENHE